MTIKHRGTFRANKGRTTTNQPLYKGSVMINDERYWFAAWERYDEEKEEKWFSFEIEKSEDASLRNKEPVDKSDVKPAPVVTKVKSKSQAKRVAIQEEDPDDQLPPF